MDAAISVIITYYNGSRFIADTLASVFNQDLTPLEIIVVDDGSRPEEAEVLDRFQDRVKIIHQKNTGVSGARNAGVALARGTWLAMLDHDDRWEPNKLSKQWEYIEAHPDCQAVHTAVRAIKHDGREVIYRKRALAFRDFLHSHPNPSYLSSTMITKQGLLLGGLFNPTLAFSEDLECFLRCSRNFTFQYLDEVLTTRIQHTANISSNYLAVWQGIIHIVRFYALQYKSDAEYRQRLYDMHMKYALHAITHKNFSAVINIIKECGRDNFSRMVFTLNIVIQVSKNKLGSKKTVSVAR